MANLAYCKVPSDNTDETLDLEAGNEKAESVSGSLPRPFRLDARFISDAVLGLSDGMTVPFALTAGLSELGDTRVVVLAGLAELVAGAISMGLGGYLGAKSEKDIYDETNIDTKRQLQSSSIASRSLRISSAFTRYNIPNTLLRDFASYISASDYLPEFLMRFEHGMDEPADSRAITCALTIATSYFIGGFIPLLPYLLVNDRTSVHTALVTSVVTMIITLFLLGYGKACLISATSTSEFTRDRVFANFRKGLKGGLQMLVVGGLSAGSAVILVKIFNSML